jgi:hypothetical protein
MPIVAVEVGVGVGELGFEGVEGVGDDTGAVGAGGLETGKTTMGVVGFDCDTGPDLVWCFEPEPWCASFPWPWAT